MNELLEGQNELYKTIANKILLSLIVLCSVWLPISLFRWFTVGFKGVFIIHILMSCSIVLVYSLNKKKAWSHKPLFVFIISFFTVLFTLSTINFGLQGGAYVVAIFGVFIIALTFSIRASIVYLLGIASLMLIVGLSSYVGLIDFSIEKSGHSVQLAAWLYKIFLIVLTSALFLITASELHKHTLKDFTTLEKQKKEVEHLANHDHLTGLATPRLAEEQLALAINLAKRHNDQVAVLYIDLDDFKRINDSLSHDAGDFALRQVAERIKEFVRDTDIACRQGGDEFLVILNYPISESQCTAICERILSAFEAPLTFRGNQIKISLSIGVAIYPDCGNTIEAIRNKADLAMYSVKSTHKNGFAFAE